MDDVHSDESIEPDELEVDGPPPVVNRPVLFRHNAAAVEEGNPLMLPEELRDLPQPDFDMSDEEGEDHTGYWRPEDLEALILGVNHHRDRIKGKFTGCAGGKERKDRAWDKVAGM